MLNKYKIVYPLICWIVISIISPICYASPISDSAYNSAKMKLETEAIRSTYKVQDQILKNKTKKDISALRNLYMLSCQGTVTSDTRTELSYIISSQVKSDDVMNQAFDKSTKKNTWVRFITGPDYRQLKKVGQEAVASRERVERLVQLSASYQ